MRINISYICKKCEYYPINPKKQDNKIVVFCPKCLETELIEPIDEHLKFVIH